MGQTKQHFFIKNTTHRSIYILLMLISHKNTK